LREFDKGADLVNGVRRERHDPWRRRIASKMVNAALRRLSGAQVLDLGCTFKVAHGRLIRSLAPGPYRVLNPVHLAASARDCTNAPGPPHPRRRGWGGGSSGPLLPLTADTVLGLSRHPFEILSVINLLVATAIVLRIGAALFTTRTILPPITNGLLLN